MQYPVLCSNVDPKGLGQNDLHHRCLPRMQRSVHLASRTTRPWIAVSSSGPDQSVRCHFCPGNGHCCSSPPFSVWQHRYRGLSSKRDKTLRAGVNVLDASCRRLRGYTSARASSDANPRTAQTRRRGRLHHLPIFLTPFLSFLLREGL